MPEQEKKGPSGFETTVKVITGVLGVIGTIITYAAGKKNAGK